MMAINKSLIRKNFYSYLGLLTNRFGFKREEQEYYYTYSTNPMQTLDYTQVVVMFDGNQIHCGITDRIKGMCSIYEYCRLHEYDFRIFFRSPFQLEDYLEPNKIDWRIKDEDIIYNQNYAVPIFINDWQSVVSLHKTYLNKIISHNPNKQIHVYGNSPYYIDRYRENFKLLFRWSDKIQQLMRKCMIEIGTDDYVAVSLRFQQLLGDFKEEHANFKTLDANGQTALMEKCRNQILALMAKKQIKTKVLVTADSCRFLEYMSHSDCFYIIPGNVAHIDNSHTKDDSIYEKLFLDMAMLSRARCIYQIVTGDMYRQSAFAHQAAILGNGNYEQILF